MLVRGTSENWINIHGFLVSKFPHKTGKAGERIKGWDNLIRPDSAGADADTWSQDNSNC